MSMIPALSFLVAASLGLLCGAESRHEFVAFGDSLCDNGEPPALASHHAERSMQSVDL